MTRVTKPGRTSSYLSHLDLSYDLDVLRQAVKATVTVVQLYVKYRHVCQQRPTRCRQLVGGRTSGLCSTQRCQCALKVLHLGNASSSPSASRSAVKIAVTPTPPTP
ncbi:hypothetical protein VaNZ11_003713, partial [Volvox africanus]